MKSLFITCVLITLVTVVPVRAQELTENVYTIVSGGHTYQVTTAIKGKEFYVLTLKTDTLKDTTVIYGDLNLPQIRLLFDGVAGKRYALATQALQKDVPRLDSDLVRLERRLIEMADSVKGGKFEASGKRNKITLESEMWQYGHDTAILNRSIREKTPKPQEKLQDSVYLAVYNNSNLFIGNFFNEKTAENWGMTNAQFSEMETMDAYVQEQNNQIDRLLDLKRSDRKMYAKKSSVVEDKQRKKDLTSQKDQAMNEYKLKIREAKNQRNITGRALQKYKRQYIQPSVYLSGSAFAYLSKSLNNDSMRSNILAVGLYAEKGDLSSMDMQITFGQSEDIISGNNRDVFGSSILVPGIRSLSLLSNFHQNTVFPKSKDRFWRHLGYGTSFNVSQVQWRWTNSDSMTINNGNAVRVVPVAIDFFASYNMLVTQKGKVNPEVKANIFIDLGLSTRLIWGNASQSKQILKHFTGSERSDYTGVLFGCKLKVDRLTIFYHGVWFPLKWFGPVPGLTGGQIVSSLGFRADIVKF